MGRRVLTAVILGGAACLKADLDAALALFTPDLIIATNNAGRDRDGPVDHWVSMHPEFFEKWIAARAAAGRPPAGRLWSAQRRRLPRWPDLDISRVENWGGSSGMLAITVAQEIEVTHAVLCGVPMTAAEAHYDDHKPWTEAGSYRKVWMVRAPGLPFVRSMSGLTRELLGEPTREWLAEAIKHPYG